MLTTLKLSVSLSCCLNIYLLSVSRRPLNLHDIWGAGLPLVRQTISASVWIARLCCDGASSNVISSTQQTYALLLHFYNSKLSHQRCCTTCSTNSQLAYLQASLQDRLQAGRSGLLMAWHRHTSLTNFTIQQSRSSEGVCVPLHLMNCLFPVPDSQPTTIEHFQSPLYGSGTVFRSISHLLRCFPSSALTWRHTSLNSVTRNYCCRAREVILSFMDTLITLPYLLTAADAYWKEEVEQIFWVEWQHPEPCKCNFLRRRSVSM